MDTAGTRRQVKGTAMTEVVDPRRGSVRASGDLTPQGVDLLRGTVECLRRSGHSVVLLDLGDVHTADAAAMDDLRALARAVAADGGELLLLSPPAVPTPRR